MGEGRVPAIARIWRGRVTAEKADAYEDYNYREGIVPLIEKAMGVQTFREDREGETEFITISYWESEAAMATFAGDDPRAIHHLSEDPDWLVELPDRVQIVKLRHSHGIVG
jgi:heme-degrading monooxygenase HmoA